MDIYSANDELYDTTFKQAIAATMTGVTADDFTAFVVAAAADTTTARRLGATFVARVLASDSVEIVYTVTLVTSTSASALVDQLTSAVGDGTFNALLHQFAADNGATALTTATSESVSATDASSSDGGDDSEVLDTGAIIGIAVGGFVVLMIIVVGIYCACARGKSAAVGTV